MTDDVCDPELPPEYDGCPLPTEPAPAPRRDIMAELRASLPLAREVTELQAHVRAATRDAVERMEQAEALARLDLAVEIIKTIPLPEPVNFIVDGLADGVRATIRSLIR